MSFKEIKGQDKTIQNLKRCLNNRRLSGTYLFTGPEGTGKALIAKTLAKALNCLGQGLDCCDRCASCLKIEKNQHPDVHLIDNKGEEIKIEQIRQLGAEINLRPYEGKVKVFIINDAHNLNSESSNAFLKTLEEPPAQSLIILISARPKLLFKTIVSRCQIFRFPPLKRNELKEILKKDYGLNETLSHFLAYFSEGSLGKALKLKEGDILATKNEVIDNFILYPKTSLDNLFRQGRNALRDTLNILAGWFRDTYLIKIGLPYSELINLDRKDALLKLMNRYTFLDLDEIFNSLAETLFYLERNVNARLLLANLRLQIWKG